MVEGWKEHLEQTKVKYMYDIMGHTNTEKSNDINQKRENTEGIQKPVAKDGENMRKMNYLLDDNRGCNPEQPERRQVPYLRHAN